MIVYFDTVRRKRPVREGGDLVKLDWESKEVLASVPIFPADPDIDDDPNPRGNSRGGKGMRVHKDELYVGTYHSLLVFDRDLNYKRRVTNNLLANVHEICFGGANVWVSSTAIDCAVLLDPQGRALKSWWPREEPLLQERYGLSPMEIDKQTDNRIRYLHADLSLKPFHTHLNAITVHAGCAYALLNRLGVLVQIDPEVRIVLADDLLRGAHSPQISADGQRLLLCSSFQKDVLVYDLQRAELLNRIHLPAFSEIAGLQKSHPDQPFNQSLFVRGLDIVDGHRILVGVAPATILEIDIDRQRLLDLFRFADDVGDAVHGLVHVK